MKTVKKSILSLLLLCSILIAAPAVTEYTYAVVIKEATYSESGWKAVADTLIGKHGHKDARIFTWSSNVTEVKDSLSTMMPTYIAFVAKPVSECNSKFFTEVSRMTRTLDTDPFHDAIWSVVTGFEAADALRAVTDTLLAETIIYASGADGNADGTNPLRRAKQSIGIDCDNYTRTKYSFSDGTTLLQNTRPYSGNDRIPTISEWLNSDSIHVDVSGYSAITGAVDIIQTGGHGFSAGWQAHFDPVGYEGFIRSQNGQLYGDPYSGSDIMINCKTPKIYLSTKNCLIGDPDNINNMVYAWFHTGRAINMYGFIPTSRDGSNHMGNGTFDRFTKFAGKYNLPESFYFALTSSVFELEHPTGYFSSYQMTMIKSYLDSTAIYGDPKANAYIRSYGDSTHVYQEELSVEINNSGDSVTYTYWMSPTYESFNAASKGYSIQLRSMNFLPRRIDVNSVEITRNDGATAEIVDNMFMWNAIAGSQIIGPADTLYLQWKAALVEKAKPVSLDLSTSMKNNKVSLKISGSKLQFNRPLLKGAELSVLSLNGKVLYKNKNITSKTININSITPGMYLWRVREAGMVTTNKFVVQ